MSVCSPNRVKKRYFYAVPSQKPRTIAYRVLQRREEGRDYTENVFRKEIAASQTSTEDRRLAQELTYGVARWERTLDWLIDRKTQGRQQKKGLQSLLRLGLYQVFWLDRIPDHAAVHETVQLGKELGFGPQSGFLNAVLRGYLREKDRTHGLLNRLREEEPAVAWSHPDDMCLRWRERWGEEALDSLLEWNNTPPPTCARVNTLRATATELEKQWRDEGVEATPAALSWEKAAAWRLDAHPPLESLESFRRGLFYIQDPSTLLAVMALDPQPGETVLDLCAAPGGKTTLIAQCMNNNGRVVATDIDPERLRQVDENADRLGATCVETWNLNQTLKARKPEPTFDRILIDAPCSNTGVIRRRVDARWRSKPDAIEDLRATQLELLKQAAAWLKPGGRICYSTCSLEPEENRGVVFEFTRNSRRFRAVTDRQLLPFIDRVDGAYCATLEEGR